MIPWQQISKAEEKRMPVLIKYNVDAQQEHIHNCNVLVKAEDSESEIAESELYSSTTASVTQKVCQMYFMNLS